MLLNKIMRGLKTLSILFFLAGVSLGQTLDEDTNWFKEIGRSDDFCTRFDFARYSIDDVLKAKRRYLEVNGSTRGDQWHGVYRGGAEAVGSVELHWNDRFGYVYFYVYHTLASLDHGSVVEDAESVRMVSEKSAGFPKRFDSKRKLIKVLYGERRFLVPEDRLPDFLDRAAGLSTSILDYDYYWEKSDLDSPKHFGTPVVPEKYRTMVRRPIETTILRIGKRKIRRDVFDDGTVNYEEAHHYVYLQAGIRQGVKVGMNFFVDELGEWIEIVETDTDGSVGRIRRDFDKNKNEQCRDSEVGQGDLVACVAVKAGMTARTKTSELYF